jgi:glycosyltransferase involved in cell wall biosynthesis
MQISGYVTVLVPAHNGALTIRRCLEAIAAQRYRPLEIVVVDDGSSDPTPGWVRSFRANQSGVPVHVVSQPRGGTGAALSAGLARARGEFVAFAHQADEWRPEKLAWQVGQLQARPEAGFSLAGVEERTARGRQLLPAPQPRHGMLTERVPLSSLVVRRRALEAVGGIDPSPGLCALHELSCRLAAQGSGLRLGRVVADCHRRAPTSLPIDQLAATFDKLARLGRLSEREARALRGRLLASGGWEALLADDPEGARRCFADAVATAPWRPAAWLGLGFAQLDRLLFATGMLRPEEPLAAKR